MNTAKAPPIGPIVRRQRKARGLTLERLASRSGVSRSMLSQVERGEANPTFAVLWALTRALDLEFADLFKGEAGVAGEQAVQLVPLTHTPEIRSADGLCRLRILSPPELAGRTEWYDVEIAPKGSLDSEAHAAGAFEHFTAFGSGLEVASGGTARKLRPGETARYAADVPHRITNRLGRTAKGLLVVLYRQ
jgi:transcriptional regulator with XRE-family HTH domain